MPDISVILATRNRAGLLAHCLALLCAQTLDASRYEICVVDNGSTDETRAAVEQAAVRYPRHSILYLYEPEPGVSRARNRGLAAAQAPYAAITDDDVRVPPDWLESFLRHFESHDARLAIVGGGVAPIWKGARPAFMTEQMQCFLSAATALGHRRRYAGPGDYFIECNSCYRRAALAAAGNFPETLGRIGERLISGENAVETAIKARGGLALYDPAIIVRHIIPAERLTPLWFRQRYFWQGVSGYAIRAYRQRHGLADDPEVLLNLPLAREDWAFAEADTDKDLHMSLHYFQSLGFVLAMTGLMPVEGS